MQTISDLGYGAPALDEIIFPRLGIDLTVSPTAFTVFGFEIQWYGIIIVIGLLLALVVAFRNMRRVGLDIDRAIDAIIAGIIGAIVGARAYYVILNWDYYSAHPASILNTREGGLAVFGGLIGAVLVGGIMCKIRKVKFLPMMDLCGVGFLIGQGIGRWGNFFNQEAFGRNTDSLFGMTGGRVRAWIVSNQTTATVRETLDPSIPVHPCFLYESVWCLLGAVLLLIALHKWRRFDGQIILMYMIWYGLGRFFIEGLRTDSLTIGTLRVSQAVAAVMVVVGTILLIVNLSRVKRLGRECKLYVDTAESRALLAEADARAAEEKARRSAKKDKSPAEAILVPGAEDVTLEEEDESDKDADESPSDDAAGDDTSAESADTSAK